MDDWKAAAMIIAGAHYVRYVRTKRDPTNIEKVVSSLILEVIDRDMYDNSKDTLERLVESVLFDDWPEARDLREFLDLKVVN